MAAPGHSLLDTTSVTEYPHNGMDQQDIRDADLRYGTIQPDSVMNVERLCEDDKGICILSLDSGGPGTISQLRLVEELVKRLESDLHKKENETRPADYFDLMGGVGFGGLAALLLGRLHMTADQAMDELSLIGTATFPNEINQSMQDLYELLTLLRDENGRVILLLISCLGLIITQAMKPLFGIATVTSQTPKNPLVAQEMNMIRLRKAIESMLERNGFPVDMMLREDSTPRCKVVVFASMTNNIAQGQPFRTYSPRGSSLDCTFVDAACAILATPEFFSPVAIGPKLRKQKFSGTPAGYNNPMRIVTEEVRQEFGDAKEVSLVLSLGSGQTTVLSSSYKHSGQDIQQCTTALARWAREGCEVVANEISHQLSDTSIYLRLNVERGLENVQHSDWHDLGSIISHTNVYLQLSPITAHIDQAVHWILRRNGSVTLGEMTRTNTRASISFQLEQLITPLQMQVKRMMDIIQLSSDNITFVDSVGNRIPIPIQFCGTFKQLEDMVLLYFDQKHPPGTGLVKKRQYRLTSGKEREVVGPFRWPTIIRPNLEVEMIMVLYNQDVDTMGCPRCGHISEGAKGAWVICSNTSCAGQFQITDRVVGDDELVSPAALRSKNAERLGSEKIGYILDGTGTMQMDSDLQRLELDNNDRTHFRLISVINRLSATQAHGGSSSALDIASIITKLADDPSDAQSWYLLGRAYMNSQEYKRAYEAYQQAVYRDGHDPKFWISIGILYSQIPQFNDALDAYSRAVRLNPYIPESWFNLGSLYETCNKQFKDAMDAYERASELDPIDTAVKERFDLLKKYIQDTSIALGPAPLPRDVDPTAYYKIQPAV